MTIREIRSDRSMAARGEALQLHSNGDPGSPLSTGKSNSVTTGTRIFSFTELYRSIRGDAPTQPPHSFFAMRERLLHGGALSPRELIALQIRAGEIGLSVELVSKIADGILGTARRLQTQQ